jgi:Arc/MetJ-type ribon-helix-helix transcriptional regulator
MSNKINWNIPVPKPLDEALEEAVEKDTHSTKSDFVRDAVRRRLEEMGFRPQIFNQNSEREGE